jgi:poly(3-hydroxybutyrate) depolymerase
MHRQIQSSVATVVLACSIAACQTSGSSESVGSTWEWGRIMSPVATVGCDDPESSFIKHCLEPATAAVEVPKPAILFLHGCAGFNNRQFRVMDLFRDNSAFVFAPDSFARPGRTASCGRAARFKHLRFAEIEFALARIRELPAVDQNRLVLAGFSAGGIAAADYPGRDFVARVVLGWDCGNGIAAPSDVSVLNLGGVDDFETGRGNSLCHFMGRAGSSARHVKAGHGVSEDPESRDIVRAFLKTVL